VRVESKKKRINLVTMRSLLILAVVLPQIVFCENEISNLNPNSNNDNEKLTQGSHLTPGQSLYCNDLNPQMHLDFNMVKKY
jgi:hypothetical protein